MLDRSPRSGLHRGGGVAHRAGFQDRDHAHVFETRQGVERLQPDLRLWHGERLGDLSGGALVADSGEGLDAGHGGVGVVEMFDEVGQGPRIPDLSESLRRDHPQPPVLVAEQTNDVRDRLLGLEGGPQHEGHRAHVLVFVAHEVDDSVGDMRGERPERDERAVTHPAHQVFAEEQELAEDPLLVRPLHDDFEHAVADRFAAVGQQSQQLVLGRRGPQLLQGRAEHPHRLLLHRWGGVLEERERHPSGLLGSRGGEDVEDARADAVVVVFAHLGDTTSDGEVPDQLLGFVDLDQREVTNLLLLV